MKAILLVRVSSISQQLDEQTNNLITYAKSKGYSQDNLIIIEDKESGIKLDEAERNGLNRMKDSIANDNTINACFVWELSRLFRRQKTGYSLREYFISNQIQLFCYSPNFQLLTDDRSEVDGAGSINFALFSEMAEAEMRNKKARFHRSKIRNAKTGKYSGGFVKYGYKVNDAGYYEINEEEAELIRYIFNEYEKGRSTYNIRKELKERGLVDTQFFVRGILTSECFTGNSNKYGMSRAYPQIISIEQFENCRKVAKENNRRADKTNEIYFCRKLIKCTECGTHYIAMKSTVMYLCYGRYGKEARISPEKACKNSSQLNINVLDSLIWDLVKELEVFRLNSNDKIEISNLENQIVINNEKISNSAKQKLKVEVKQERNNFMYLEGQILLEKYILNSKKIDEDFKVHTDIMTSYENENKKIEIRINDLTTKFSLLETINDKAEYLDNLVDNSLKYEIVKRHIKEINILDDVKNVTKIVLIQYYNKPSDRFKIHISKNPVIVELDSTYQFGGSLPEIWMNFPLEVTRRFERKK